MTDEGFAVVTTVAQFWPVAAIGAVVVAILRCVTYVVRKHVDHKHNLQTLDRLAALPPAVRRDYIALERTRLTATRPRAERGVDARDT
ncbi:hypothetical protein ACFQHV_12965 [Promicromonospora thailandica]|uniref:Uncharacterized protein n=1 Tax=Promicromonospora thailandica TaxID=765201 RepID=A0A9X2G5A7_9MICO|nr:hypothetical protein [Promicromonospora thailandica]MCP2265985.1 hypothetical protein [Promicromonospora thailandica]BFF21432.1 hypothetical protein GCM10025730_49530 [Promicromonospora thailandica]